MIEKPDNPCLLKRHKRMLAPGGDKLTATEKQQHILIQGIRFKPPSEDLTKDEYEEWIGNVTYVLSQLYSK